MEEVVSLSASACCCVLSLSDRLPCEMSNAPCCTALTAPFASPITSVSLRIVRLVSLASFANSPSYSPSIFLDRSPLEIAPTTIPSSLTTLSVTDSNSFSEPHNTAKNPLLSSIHNRLLRSPARADLTSALTSDCTARSSVWLTHSITVPSREPVSSTIGLLTKCR